MNSNVRSVFLFLGVLVLILAACTTPANELPGTGDEGTPPAIEPAETSPATTPAVTEPVGGLPPAAVLEAQRQLAEQLGLPIEQVLIGEFEQMEWSDSCLGLGGPAESCAAVITPGWRATFDVGGQLHEVRTDETGQVVRFATPTGENPLAGTQWELASYGQSGAETPAVAAAVAEEKVTLAFEEGGQAGGSAGCNSYGGRYQVEGSTISFSEVISTLKACTDESLMQQEQSYLQALETASSFKLAGDSLTIQYGDGQGVLNFVKAAAEGE